MIPYKQFHKPFYRMWNKLKYALSYHQVAAETSSRGAEGRMATFFKNEKIQMLTVAIGTAVAGEFKINPVQGDLFRIGLGGSAFLLLMLLMNRLPYLRTGIFTALTVVVFRMMLDFISAPHLFSIDESARVHTSAGLYYMTFAIGMFCIQSRLTRMNLLLLSGVTACIDFGSNTIEMICRWILTGSEIMIPATWGYIFLVAVIRGFFTTGLYSSISVSQIRALHSEQKKRMEQMLAVNAGLYGEVFYLRKSMDTIEHLTSSSYRLYMDMKREGLTEYSQRQLSITQEIHEVKKDSQRIAAGLLKLFDQKSQTALSLFEILDYTIRGNRKYATMLAKKVTFTARLEVNYITSEYIPLLTILNNLTSNAVEALGESGSIEVSVWEQGQDTILTVYDSGKGIDQQARELIFEPGFTTKFAQGGSAATGIGLSHVHDIVCSLGGTIQLQEAEDTVWQTIFEVKLPTLLLKKGE
ncbi:Histidine kinase [Paenibacillus nuruki]|uniref:histidine kinase n=2 Tax=Paenibacillus nuruki TaxID=1886670 RepID=A0A1E3L6I2_9BACL|nr:Histidine kinase [Paenibacillus nuruki]